MKQFYKLNPLQVGSGEIIPESFIEYTVGNEPLALVEALEQEALEQELQAKINEASQYLKDTDWYYARKAETGEEVPVGVVAKRIDARQFIKNNG